jgi:hypothetical protein
VYRLASNCVRDEVVRKFAAPVLELIMLDKALKGEFNRERAKLLFDEMYATAVAGDDTVGPDEIMLTVGGELGGGAALLRLAALHLLNQLLPDELKFNSRAYMKRGRYYDITAGGENAVGLRRLLAVTAPSDGGEYLSEKFVEFVEAARLEVRLGDIRRTKRGAAADLTISEAGVAVKYNVYLSVNAIELEFRSTDRSRVELAARLLKLAGVGAELKKKVGGRDEWYVKAATDILAAGRKELRDALADIVKTALVKGWVNADKTESWLKKLERGRVLKEGWPKYHVGLSNSALVVRFSSTNPNNIERETQRLRDMGLVEGEHFVVKMPEEGRYGYVSILREGLAYAAWLSVYSKDEQQKKLAAEFVNYIPQRAEEAGKEVYEKARKIVDEGKERGSLTLKGFEKEVEVDGRRYKVKVIDGGAVKEKRNGKTLLRIKITAEVDGVRSDYTITFIRYGRINRTEGYAYARADAPGVRNTDAERFSALVKALTGREPRVRRMKGRQDSDNVLRGASGGLHALLGACRRHREVAGGDEPPMTPPQGL